MLGSYRLAAEAAAEMAAEEEKNIKSWFFTFGHGHPFANCYVGVIAPNGELARFAMNHIFGQRWGFMYATNDPINGINEQVEQHHIQPLLHLNVVEQRSSDQPLILLIPQHEFVFATNMDR